MACCRRNRRVSVGNPDRVGIGADGVAWVGDAGEGEGDVFIAFGNLVVNGIDGDGARIVSARQQDVGADAVVIVALDGRTAYAETDGQITNGVVARDGGIRQSRRFVGIGVGGGDPHCATT